MDPSPAPALDVQLEAALEWWRLAGVDLAFDDEPRALLTDEEKDDLETKGLQKAEPEVTAPSLLGGEPTGWPRDLAAFRQWWVTELSLALEGAGQRIAPSGEAGAQLMILVPMPEAGDEAKLLSGSEGRLIAGMVRAVGVRSVYLASALPAHLPDPDWTGLERRGFGEVLMHHLALARPARLLVLGRSVLPLLGHDLAQGAALIKKTSIQDGAETRDIPTLAGFAPDRLLHNARQRAALWRRWLDWTDSD